MDMNKVLRQFPLALATLTLKYMQEICPPEKEYYVHLKGTMLLFVRAGGLYWE